MTEIYTAAITAVVTITGGYFVMRPKLAELRVKQAEVEGTFEQKLLDTAKGIVEETMKELREEVRHLRKENATLRQTVNELHAVNAKLREEVATLASRFPDTDTPEPTDGK